MHKPNPQQTWQEFWEEWTNQLQLHGIAYVWLCRSFIDNQPKHLYVLRSVDVIRISDPKSNTYGYLAVQHDGSRKFLSLSEVMVSHRAPDNESA